MLTEAVDCYPVVAVVAQCPSGKAHAFWIAVTAFVGSICDKGFDDRLAVLVVPVSGIWSGHTGKVKPNGFHRLFHRIRGLLLSILVAVVGDCREVGEVGWPIGCVVPLPELHLPFWKGCSIGIGALELRGLAKSGSGRSGGPFVCMMYREVPRRPAAHREPTNGDTVFINPVAALDICHRFKRIGLASNVVCIAEASIRMEDKDVIGSKIAQ